LQLLRFIHYQAKKLIGSASRGLTYTPEARPPPKDSRELPYDPGELLWDTPEVFENYEKLEPFKVHDVIRCTKYKTPLAKERDNYYRFEDYLFSKAPEDLKTKLLDRAGAFYRVVGTVDSIDKSIRKTDFPRATKYKTDPHWREAKAYTWDMFFDVLQRNWHMATMDEIWTVLDLDTACGVPFALLGFRKKKDFMSSEYCIHFLFDDPRKYRPPVWKTAGKMEWYPLHKLLSGDVRTFIIPPMPLLYFQKVLYHAQNIALMLYKWSAYGFDPYHGGTDRLAKRLCVNGRFIYYDVKSWDRLLPIMRNIYKLRNKAIPERWHWLCKWVTENTVSSYLLLPDGRIIFKDNGNNSGSGNTTTDNIIGHSFITATWLLHLFDGDTSRLDEAVVTLFGDDNVSSIPETGYSKDYTEKILHTVFEEFGMTLDPCMVVDDLEGVEFLGFRFKRYASWWIPKYDTARLLAAFCYDYERMPLPAMISKAYTLTVMAAGCDDDTFEIMGRIFESYLKRLEDEQDPTIQAYVHLGAPRFVDCLAFYLGWEAGAKVSTLFDFSYYKEVMEGTNREYLEQNVRSESNQGCETQGAKEDET